MIKSTKKKDFDIVIIGAGLSGLSLAIEIIKRTKFTVLLLEKKRKLQKDKNWCFWNYPKNIFTTKYDNSWENIKIFSNRKEIIKSDKYFKYLRLSSERFYNLSIKILNNSKNCKVKFNSKIKKISEKKSFVNILVNDETVTCKMLFNSIPRPIVSNELKQHFLGLEVTSNKKIFNDKEVTLMDFQENNKQIHFFYVLPFSKNKALIESTYFSKTVYNEKKYIKDIKLYLSEKYPDCYFNFGFKEKGVLPMYSNKEKSLSNLIIPIGQTSNWIKISTGYCFQNAFEKSYQIVNKLINNSKISTKQRFINKFLDEIFCEFLSRYPGSAQNFFYNFFKYLNIKTIVFFLTEKQNFWDILKILRVLPKKELIISTFFLFLKKINYASRY